MDKELLKLLGLSETATVEEVRVAVNKLKTAVEGSAIIANKAVLDALGLKDDAKESEITGTIMAMKQSHGTVGDLSTEVADLKTRLKVKDDQDIEAMVNKAIEGDDKGAKVLPSQKDWAMGYAKKDPEGFKVYLNKAPYAIQKGQKVPDQETAAGDFELQVNKYMELNKVTRGKAIAAVAKANPDAHQDYLGRMNPKKSA